MKMRWATVRVLILGLGLVCALGAGCDCGGGGEDAGEEGDTGGARDAGHVDSDAPSDAAGGDAAGRDVTGPDLVGRDTYQPQPDAAQPDTAGTDLVGRDTYQPPRDAAVPPDSASATDAACPTRVCDGVCCQPGEECSALTDQCCAADCTNKACGDDGCGGSCGDCPGQMCGASQQCVPITTPVNDSCAGTIPLAFDGSGVALVMGDTTGATADSSSFTCGMGGTPVAGGKDVVYAFTLTEATPMSFALTYPDGPIPMLYLTTACPSTSAADEMTCSFQGTGDVASWHTRRLAAGTHYLWVDTFEEGAGGPFTLLVSKDEIPANDTCAGAVPLDVSSGHAEVTVDVTDIEDDYAGLCVPMIGYDAVYSFTIAQHKQVVAEIRHEWTMANSAIYIRRVCDSSQAQDEVACNFSTSIYGGGVNVTIPRLDPGTYYVFVDSFDQVGGDATLTLTVTDPASAPDSCASAELLSLDQNNQAMLQFNTALGDDDTAPAGCNGVGDGDDVVYRLHLDQTRNVFIEVWGMPGIIVYVRDVCDSTSPGDELGCETVFEGTEIDLPELAEGDYWIWLDAASSGAGVAGTLRVTATLPLGNDTCDGAQPLTFSGNQATVSGDATTASDDYLGSCGGNGYVDLVYAFTLSEQKIVTATVAMPVGNSYYGLYLRSVCDSAPPSDEVGCSLSSTPVTVTANLQPGTYYAIVERSSVAPGAFNLTLTLSDPPANDTCAGAIPIVVDQVVEGDTTHAADDYGTDGLSEICGYIPMPAPDLVYSFTPEVSGTYLLSSSCENFYYYFWIATTCGGASECFSVGTCEATGLEAQAGVTYYIVVDSDDPYWGWGPFSFTLTSY